MALRLPQRALRCACTLLVGCAPLVHPEVTACADADGRLTYTQFDCPTGTRATAAEPADNGLSIVRTAPLSAAEQAALERLERTLAADRARREKAQRRQAARQQAARVESGKRCEDARRALETLAETRRKGYTAAEDRRFDAEEARWKAVRRSDC